MGGFRGKPPLNLLKVSREVRGLAQTSWGYASPPADLMSLSVSSFIKIGCLSGPTIFLGHPEKCRCDDALPAWGEGNGGSHPLYNERLGVPIIFMFNASSHPTPTLAPLTTYNDIVHQHHEAGGSYDAPWGLYHSRSPQQQLVPAV